MPNARAPDPVSVRRRLLRWYDAKARDLPWRYKTGRYGKGERPDPYRVWISEIMLQQTTVATVRDYYLDFLARWPTVEALAGTDLGSVLHAWQGLGYYARARNLHKCARILAGDMEGRFPETEAELKKLPGIGDYTAAAVAAIAFGKKATPVDANIERVTARLFACADPWPKGRRRIAELARVLTPAASPRARPGDFAQAMMDLGATVCTPKSPDCGACPLKAVCVAVKTGDAGRYPVKAAKKPRPVRHGMVFWARLSDGRVLLRQRPEKGLLGGMTEIPSTGWRDRAWTPDEAASEAPVAAAWEPLGGVVHHTFTHFHLELRVLMGRVKGRPGKHSKGKRSTQEGLWCAPERFKDHPLPTVMKKVARHVADFSARYSS